MGLLHSWKIDVKHSFAWKAGETVCIKTGARCRGRACVECLLQRSFRDESLTFSFHYPR
ncbi:hypothetical protein KSD_53930 [Ktedonobacter sp. SOSP1-85]|nr:hypothetical protein KSD_53930 [Ktedonobacter sp. SOSP1-85]